jgi:hypothetical protein
MKPAAAVLLVITIALIDTLAPAQDSRPDRPPESRKAAPVEVGNVPKDAGKLVKLLEVDRNAEAATRALVRLGEQALPPLIVALDDPRPKVRRRAVRTLGAMGEAAKSVLPRLQELARSADGELAFPAFEALARVKFAGQTIVADYSDNRIFAVDRTGKQIFEIEEIFGVWDVERLPNGNLLLTEFSVNRVREMTLEGRTVWAFDNLKNPYDADRLPNGNTLIADTFGRRVIEVNKAEKIIWKYDTAIQPYDAERMPNGNTLIADGHQDRVIEVDKDGKIVWKLENMPNCHDVDALPNGNVLLTIRMLNLVREVDRDGKTILEIKNLSAPSDADRLPNGDTIVAENGCVRRFDKDGKQVSRIATTWAVEVNSY